MPAARHASSTAAALRPGWRGLALLLMLAVLLLLGLLAKRH